MKIRDIIFLFFDFLIWYLFIYLWLFSIQSSVSLKFAAFMLLLLLVLGVLFCPLVYKNSSFKSLLRKRRKEEEELKVKEIYEEKRKNKR